MEENVNMKYLGEQFGHMNATILMELKNDLCSMSLEEIKKEVKSHNYPIKDIKKLTKEEIYNLNKLCVQFFVCLFVLRERT